MLIFVSVKVSSAPLVIEGAGKKSLAAQVCASAAVWANHIAAWLKEPATGKEDQERRRYAKEIEDSNLPLAQKVRLQGLLALIFISKFPTEIQPIQVGIDYYLSCMDLK
jgi:hypothetical protein